ncbi:Putative Thioredoxin domain, protein disulfide-isomerase A6 [Septoria linicola]|uniref:protein disulfide-isomerase n=1 Tax=Septoria linicola TaxID=215465 RepID=A0A9Q9ELM0_9PEZI|nr:putative Thioredoxin domain, protein disulfide-isomerase A6 [Septoria linicola]USW54494.1 Putative Thioredoxin domain, protein disulfide-isomerase A6 [Septoria linicola]
MVHSLPLAIAAASLLLPAANAFYDSSSPVIQADGRSYNSIVNKSNHTSIVEFYAPWCGHCQNLKPAYEKAAKSLSGLAKVVAVNCDDEGNKQLCGSLGVQGFPTLKIVRPGKKPGKPTVEDYKGQRGAKDIVDAVIANIPNHVKRLKDADYADWVAEGTGPKAILFSNKGPVSAMLKSVAIDFLGALEVAQIRDKETEAVGTFEVEKYPTLVLLPGDGKDPIKYDGELKKPAIVKFLSQAATPNPDPPKQEKKAKSASSDKKKASSSSSKFAKSSASQKSSESAADETATPETKPTPKAAPPRPAAAPITTLGEPLALQQKCLNDKAGTCVLALLPEEDTPSESTTLVIKSLSDLQQKYEGRKLFPFYQIPHANPQNAALRTKLALNSGKVELIAINGKRSWFRHFTAADFHLSKIEDWVDAIRMGDSPKSKLADGLIIDAAELPAEQVILEDPKQVKQKETTPDPDNVEPESDAVKKMKEQLKAQMPEGVQFEMEELDDDQYEKIMKQAETEGKEAEPAAEHDEL